MDTRTHINTHLRTDNKCTTKEIRGTSDIRISLSRHPFPSNALEMRVVMVTGAEKSPHVPPHPPWHTSTYTHIYRHTHKDTPFFPFLFFFSPLSLRLSGHCWCHRWNYEFNIQVRDAYLGRSKPSGDVEKRKKKWNKSLVGWQIDTASERPWNLKEKVIKNERKILNSISPRFALRMLAFCSAFSFSGAIRPFSL